MITTTADQDTLMEQSLEGEIAAVHLAISSKQT